MNRTYRILRNFIRGLLWVFFRQVRVAGLENVPTEGGGLVVAWHPNALLDPGLILATLPRRVVFGARSGLFRVPLLGALMRAVGTVPIHRRRDVRTSGLRGPEVSEDERRAANRRSLDALAAAIAEGDFAALFPEGESHDEPDVQELKTGAASLFYRALEMVPAGEPTPVILPVGLHYDEKGRFGSRVMVVFHPPLELPEALATAVPEPPAGETRAPSSAAVPLETAAAVSAEAAVGEAALGEAALGEAGEEDAEAAGEEAGEDARRRCYRLLTELIEKALQESVYGVTSWRLHHLMQRSRKLMRAERAARARRDPGRPDIEERVLGFARLWKGYQERLETHPQEVADLVERVEEYDDDLRTLRLEDHELDEEPAFAAYWPTLLLGLQVVVVYLLLPPLLIIGYLVNLPTALLLIWISKIGSKAYKDEATVKLLLGALAFPATWLAVALAVAWGERHLAGLYPQIPNAPVWTGLIAFCLSAVGGAVALVYWRLARVTLRNLRVRRTRRRSQEAVADLRHERAALFDKISALAEGLDLPGEVAPDGRVVAGPRPVHEAAEMESRSAPQ